MKIYLKHITVNYTEIRNYKGNFMFEDTTKKYPIGYIEHGLIYGIDKNGVIYPPKKLDSDYFNLYHGDEITETEYKKASTMIRYKKYSDWEKQELRAKLRLRISVVIPKIYNMITSEMLQDRKKYSDKWNKVVGRIGYEYPKSLGFMQVINEIEKHVKI